MRTITQEQLDTRDELIKEASEAASLLEAAVSNHNNLVKSSWGYVDKAEKHYNDIVGKIQDWISEIVGHLEQYTEEQEDLYDNGDKKQQNYWDEYKDTYATWVEHYTNSYLEDSDLDPPESIDCYVSDLVEEILNLPTSIEEVK